MARADGPCFPPNFAAWRAIPNLNQTFGDVSGTAASELAWESPRVLPFQTLSPRFDPRPTLLQPCQAGALCPNHCPRWLFNTVLNLPLKDCYLQKAHPRAQPARTILRLLPCAPSAGARCSRSSCHMPPAGGRPKVQGLLLRIYALLKPIAWSSCTPCSVLRSVGDCR